METKIKNDLLVLKELRSGYRVKDINTNDILSIKTSFSLNVSELDTISFEIAKEWTFKKHKYMSGSVKSNEFILSNIHVKKLEYESAGIWDPHKIYADEADVYFSDYIKEGYRESFIFKDYSGFGFYNEEDDPVYEAVELKEMGNYTGFYNKLTRLWEDFPECIDALVHLGNNYFYSNYFQNRAFNCYLAAIDIAERGFPKEFDGIFLWGHHENRPYLRALHGLCLTYWKNNDFNNALKVCEKILRLNPGDGDAQSNIMMIKNHKEWKED